MFWILIMPCHNVYSRFNNIITRLHISFFTIVTVTYFNSTRIWLCPGSTGRYTLHKTLIEIKTYTGLSIISSHILKLQNFICIQQMHYLKGMNNWIFTFHYQIFSSLYMGKKLSLDQDLTCSCYFCLCACMTLS